MKTTKTVTTNTTIVAFALAFIFALSFVSAAVVSPQTLTPGTSETRDLSTLPTQTVNAQGGNVTQVDIEVLTVTQSWQGYFGNISGEITLDDANNNTFYNWTLTSASGEVYGVRSPSVDFTTVVCANAGNVSAEETYLGQSASDGDSVTNTYSTTTHPAFNVSTAVIAVDTCFSTNAYVNNASNSAEFHQILLADASSNIVYTTIIDGNTGFDGTAYDFELLVGENDHSGSEGPTTYYFFVELN